MKTDSRFIIFVSSSGHCNLNCPYCIIKPVVKNHPSLNMDDINFLLCTLKEKTFLCFSGKGDFFSGYKEPEKLLMGILKNNVEISLDINGVLIHEFPKLPNILLSKIRAVNLTMHYQQLEQKRLLDVWAQNAITIINRGNYDLLVGTVISPLVQHTWDKALEYYERKIFNTTQQKITVIRDVHTNYSDQAEEEINYLSKKFSHIIQKEHVENFPARFSGRSEVLCPAGFTYLRIWNNGDIQGCPNIKGLQKQGNVKQRKLMLKKSLFKCSTPEFCDCNVIDEFGRMHLQAE